MRIAVDAMGGDHAPEAIVAGVIEALGELNGIAQITLVGKEEIVAKELSRYSIKGMPVVIKNAEQMIEMHESPAQAVKTKKDSSIVVATRALKEGEVQAVVSAGNTGAVMASSLMELGRLEGVNRPAIATLIPTLEGVSILLDVGANVDCKSNQLLQFAMMGDVYARYILKKTNPKIGLLSIGEEEGKGNALTCETFDLLQKTSLNFIGNVEGRDIINGKVDVIVCDGFVGNVVLKFGESLAEMIIGFLKRELSKNISLKLGAFLSKPAFKKFKKLLDYSEYGGAPLLGVDGVCIICHGASSAKAIKNGIRVACEFIDHQVNLHIEESIKGK
ncbi:MAG: phosphate acyltransferase PlsX [bacterium]|nr:phosphate acyltransferase PlsX [bacterium]